MPHLELNNGLLRVCFHYTCVGLHVSGTHQTSSRGEVKAACQKLQKAELTGSGRTAQVRSDLGEFYLATHGRNYVILRQLDASVF